MNARGFTVLELLFSLCIVCILMIVGIPNLFAQVKLTQLNNSIQTLSDSIEYARSRAVFTNKRVTIKNNGGWEQGWEVFLDINNNGIRDNNEQLLAKQLQLPNTRLIPNAPVQSYISFIGTGESRMASANHNGAFQAGTINICPLNKGKGIAIVLSRSGRIRTQPINETICN